MTYSRITDLYSLVFLTMQRSLVHLWIALHIDSNKLHCISPSKNRFTKPKEKKETSKPFFFLCKSERCCGVVVGWDIIEKTLINISSVASLSSFLIIINLRRETDYDDDKHENDNDSNFFLLLVRLVCSSFALEIKLKPAIYYTRKSIATNSSKKRHEENDKIQNG